MIVRNAQAITIGTGVAVDPAGTLFIGTGGNLKCTLADMVDGTYVTFNNIPDGTDFPRLVKYIHADTTCSNIIADISGISL